MVRIWEGQMGDSLGDRNNIQVVYPHMEEAGRAQRDDWRADIAVRDDLYPKDISYGSSGVIGIGSDDSPSYEHKVART